MLKLHLIQTLKIMKIASKSFKYMQNLLIKKFQFQKTQDLAQNLSHEETNLLYNNSKDELNEIYEDISNIIKIRRHVTGMNFMKNQTNTS